MVQNQTDTNVIEQPVIDKVATAYAKLNAVIANTPLNRLQHDQIKILLDDLGNEISNERAEQAAAVQIAENKLKAKAVK